MMESYYKATVKVSYEDKKGNVRYRKENYLVFAASPTDVDAKVAKHLGVEDYELVGINLSGVVEVIK